MRQFTTSDLSALLAAREPPCVSLYQPTHRRHPENQQDPIRYRNLLRELATSLAREYPAPDVRALVSRFEALGADEEFWNHRTEGLAVLGTQEEFHVFELQRPVPELLVVADSYHLKPLLRIVQSADRYHVLCLNRQAVRLYEGNRDALDEVTLANVPTTIEEALGEELTEPHLTVASYGVGAGGQRSGQGESGMHHGHGGKKDEVDNDTVRFFRAVDRAILEHYSRPSGLPLLLAALAEYHAPFRQVSSNPFLLAEGIMTNPDALSAEQLRTQAWRVLEPQYRERLDRLTDSFQLAQSRQLGSDDLSEIAAAAAAGRVGTLLVEAERVVPGRIEGPGGTIEFGLLHEPHTDDLLDDLAELTLRTKGEVVVVPADRMPGRTGAAAVYRY